MNSRTILVVDDEQPIRRVLRATLCGDGYEVIEAKSGEEAIKAVLQERPDLILLDVNMPRKESMDRTMRAIAHTRAHDNAVLIRSIVGVNLRNIIEGQWRKS